MESRWLAADWATVEQEEESIPERDWLNNGISIGLASALVYICAYGFQLGAASVWQVPRELIGVGVGDLLKSALPLATMAVFYLAVIRHLKANKVMRSSLGSILLASVLFLLSLSASVASVGAYAIVVALMTIVVIGAFLLAGLASRARHRSRRLDSMASKVSSVLAQAFAGNGLHAVAARWLGIFLLGALLSFAYGATSMRQTTSVLMTESPVRMVLMRSEGNAIVASVGVDGRPSAPFAAVALDALGPVHYEILSRQPRR